MADRQFDIVIGGGGFAGIALAQALVATLGCELMVALVDRVEPRAMPATGADPRCSALSEASRRMLAALGIWQPIAARAEPIRTIDITDTSLDSVFRSPVLSYDNIVDQDRPASYVIENADLRQAMAQSLPGVTVLAGHGIASFTEGPAAMHVTLDNGDRLDARLLVAADGRGSRLREIAGIKVTARSYDQVGITAIIAHEKPHAGRAVQHFLPAGPFAVLPLTGNRSCITWTEEAVRGRAIVDGSDAQFLAEVEKRFGFRLGALSLAGRRGAWPLEMALARDLIKPRFALLGDAARTVHPIAGQGLNLALRDAAALVEVIADAMRLGLDPGSQEALARYQRWRRFDGAASAALMDGLNRLFSNDLTLLRTIRDVGLGLVDRSPQLKALLVREAAGLAGDVPRLLEGNLP